MYLRAWRKKEGVQAFVTEDVDGAVRGVGRLKKG